MVFIVRSSTTSGYRDIAYSKTQIRKYIYDSTSNTLNIYFEGENSAVSLLNEEDIKKVIKELGGFVINEKQNAKILADALERKKIAEERKAARIAEAEAQREAQKAKFEERQASADRIAEFKAKEAEALKKANILRRKEELRANKEKVEKEAAERAKEDAKPASTKTSKKKTKKKTS